MVAIILNRLMTNSTVGSQRFKDVTRGSDRPSVSLSVCHATVLCQNGLTYRHTFSPCGSHTILVFPHQTFWQYSDGDPHNGGVE